MLNVCRLPCTRFAGSLAYSVVELSTDTLYSYRERTMRMVLVETYAFQLNKRLRRCRGVARSREIYERSRICCSSRGKTQGLDDLFKGKPNAFTLIKYKRGEEVLLVVFLEEGDIRVFGNFKLTEWVTLVSRTSE